MRMKIQMKKNRLQNLWIGRIFGLAVLIWSLATPQGGYADDESQGSEAPAFPETLAVGSSDKTEEGSTELETADWEETAVESESALAAEEMEASYFSVMAKLGLGLGLVILLAWGAVYLLRKTAVGQQLGGAGGMIRVAERVYLGPKKFVCLVEIGGKALALGVTEEHISTLTQWDEGELELPPDPAISGAFASQFRSLLGQAKDKSRSGSSEGGKV
jgi:flagellar biosynthetic protein FliO